MMIVGGLGFQIDGLDTYLRDRRGTDGPSETKMWWVLVLVGVIFSTAAYVPNFLMSLLRVLYGRVPEHIRLRYVRYRPFYCLAGPCVAIYGLYQGARWIHWLLNP